MIFTSSEVACSLQMAQSGFAPSTRSFPGLVVYAATTVPSLSANEGMFWGLCPCTPVSNMELPAARGIGSDRAAEIGSRGQFASVYERGCKS